MILSQSNQVGHLRFWDLAERILAVGAEGPTRVDFLRQVSGPVLAFSGCDELEIRSQEREVAYRWIATTSAEKPVYCRIGDDLSVAGTSEDETLRRSVAGRRSLERWGPGNSRTGLYFHSMQAPTVTGWPCLLIIAMDIPSASDLATGDKGLLELRSRRLAAISARDVEIYEYLAKLLGWAISNRRAEAALRERVKELTCLYAIARSVQRRDVPLDRVLGDLVTEIPLGLQFPHDAVATIRVDGREFTSSHCGECDLTLAAPIAVEGVTRGSVSAGYRSTDLEYPEDAFLHEETTLVDAIASEISVLLEGRAFETEKRKLEAQLRHADRLATIGELAAGVAHELNEPLSEVLGFAQLAKKSPDLPAQTAEDIGKIEHASMHARDVVRKLLTFARKMPGKRELIDLSCLVRDGLSFLSSRCSKEGIELILELADTPVELVGDPAQLNQVVVNLVVNAIQAMPGGGRLLVQVESLDGTARLVVTDTGIGMNEQTLASIFIPFFTTKESSEGTGLGLSVVHGIVSSHGGTIAVDSRLGKGSRFEVRLPHERTQE